MNYKKWTEQEYNFLKVNFGKIETSLISEKLERTENAVRLNAYRLGLCNPTSQERRDKRKKVFELIKSGIECPWELAKLSGFSKDTTYKLLLSVKVERKQKRNITEKKEGFYFLSEDEILNSLNPVYNIEDLDAWEKFQAKQETPKGFEYPKLNTNKLNTYKL